MLSAIAITVPAELQAALERRVDAAIQLVSEGLDPALMLSFVVWPTQRLADASEQAPTRAQLLELVSAGMGQLKSATAAGVSRGAVQEALKRRDLQMRLRL